ncbi:MAG: hypothetical protein JNM63_11530, partial [Spirochaetia bacterium]|nr:hypothetical protein [Spirochaetia bacterium]
MGIIKSILFVFLLVGSLWPCGGGYYSPWNYASLRMSFLDYDLTGDTLFTNFYFSRRYRFNNSSQMERVFQTERELASVREWKAYCRNQVSDDAINSILSTDIYLSRLNPETEKPSEFLERLTQSKPENDFLHYLIKQKDADALAYLAFNRWIQGNVAFGASPWQPLERDTAAMKKDISLALGRYKEAKSDFIKLRYAYQVVRLADFSKENEQAVKYYESLVPQLKTESAFKYWAEYHYANILGEEDKTRKWALYSLIFDQSPDMMNKIYWRFPYLNNKELESSLKILGNPHQQATLWMLQGLRSTQLSLDPLKKMLTLEPGSLRNEILLLRLSGELESAWLGSHRFLQ